jgi:hypothetical protein
MAEPPSLLTLLAEMVAAVAVMEPAVPVTTVGATMELVVKLTWLP